MKYLAQIVEEFSGYGDYWSGHGHVFEKKAIGCITLMALTNYSETEKEIGKQLLEDPTEFEDLTDNQSLDLDLANNALKDLINIEFKSDKPLFDPNFYDKIDLEDLGEGPIYLIVVHIFKEIED